MLAASTLGSLFGVFGTSHVLLPSLGLGKTFLLAGGLLLSAGAGASFLARRRPSHAGTGVLLAIAGWGGTLPLGEAEGPPLGEGLVSLATAESPYQSLRVVEDHTREPPMRFLQVNEGFDSFQSAWQRAPGLLPDGFYYNDFILPCAWAGWQGPWRVLVLGLGAGTVLRVFEGACPPDLHASFIGVELDPAMIELGRAFFDLQEASGAREIWSGLDARLALRVPREALQEIILDCYANQV